MTMPPPGMTGQNSFQGHPPPFPGSILADSFQGIDAAAGSISALGAQKRRNPLLVESYQTNQQRFHEWGYLDSGAASPEKRISFSMIWATRVDHSIPCGI